MKICEKTEKRKEFPEVVGGDIIKVKTADYPLYLLVTDNDIGLRLIDIENGTPWSTGSLWGSALNPSQVEVVTDRVCLNVL